jgi:Na+-translocating ferredoxin:NAD+ oxidoreductase RnfD subunit
LSELVEPSSEPLEARAASSAPTWHARLFRLFPPNRLVWIFLAGLGVLGSEFLLGLGAASLLTLPIVAALSDLTFQRLRYPSLRIPDAALATGLFIALLVPPSVPLLSAGVITFAAIGVKHVLRYQGRPILNPAATGVIVGVFLFGLAPAWWAGIGPYGEWVLVALAIALIARAPTNWRLPVTFFVIYAPFSVAMKLIVGAALAPKLLALGVIDPATLFFGLYLVAEPRTAPANPHLQPLYAAVVAFGAVFLPLVMPGPGVLVALLLTNFGAVLFRVAISQGSGAVEPVASAPVRRRSRRRRPRSDPARPAAPPSWSIPQRVTAGILILFVVGVMAAATYAPTATPSVNSGAPPHLPGAGSGGGGGSQTAASCVKDNPSIGSSTLQALHRALGPSVILSYDPSTGTTVFYDPVNSVTVTETDLYEDYGFAEFNGDDFAVSGCSP